MKIQKGISACIITRNEQLSLPDCLRSLSFADEIIILDSFSSDKTTKIAKSFNAKIYKRKFDNFINQKNSCIDRARHEWILSIDADEIISSDLAKEIIEIAENNDTLLNGYYIPRKTLYLDQWINHSGWYPNYTIRLFRNNFGRFTGYNVHENVEIEGRAGKIKNHILHYSYNNISEHIEKINYYSTLIAHEKFMLGKRSSIMWAILKSISKFFLTYIWRLGLLDGKAGLIIAVLGSYYNFQKYIKLWELQKKSN